MPIRFFRKAKEHICQNKTEYSTVVCSVAAIGLSIFGLYKTAEYSINKQNANDALVSYESESTSSHGFDDNKDGCIDRIEIKEIDYNLPSFESRKNSKILRKGDTKFDSELEFLVAHGKRR